MSAPDARGRPASPRGRTPLSLRARIMLLATVGVGAIVVLVSLAVFFTVRTSLYNQLDENLLQRASAATNTGLADPQQLAQVPTEALGAGDVRLALVFSSGRAQSSRGQASAPPLGPDEVRVARGQLGYSVRSAELGGVPYRVVAVPAGQGRALVLAQRLEPIRSSLARLALVLVLVGASGVLLAAAAGVAVAGAGLRPVQRLIGATERVARTGELTPIPVSGSDELARLAASYNAMVEAVVEARERQQQLVADASHELRTPLTSLRTNIELLLATGRPGAGSLPETDRQEMVSDVASQLSELSTLVDDLVQLARDEPRQTTPQPVEMADVVGRAVERARRRGEVEFDVSLRPWTVLGDAASLERAVLNLLDNAVKWSPPSGTVTVRLEPTDPRSAVLSVADQGSGIAEGDLPHVFDRFYRSGPARTMSGSGLGLAIVKQIAHEHGGSVWAGAAPGGGALLQLRLPGGQVPQQDEQE